MAVQVQYPDQTFQWLPGGNERLPVNLQTVPDGCKIISTTPDSNVTEWRRRRAWSYGNEIVK